MNGCEGKKMFYLNYVPRPSYMLLKYNPKEYWKQWKDYTKARINYQIWKADMDFDRCALASMRANSMGTLGMGTPCSGCTLGGGLGLLG